MLFGHQNDDTPTEAVQAEITPVNQDAATNPIAVDPTVGTSLPATLALAPPPLPPNEEPEPSVLNQPASVSTPNAEQLDTPALAAEPAISAQSNPIANSTELSPTPASDALAHALEQPLADLDSTPEPDAKVDPIDTPAQPTSEDDQLEVPSNETLLSLKQQALQQLTPLVDQLDQTAEEKFRTTMMMIQSTDNPTLIQDAYETAQSITDEKVRAQALLDVINEINYFTQQKPAA